MAAVRSEHNSVSRALMVQVEPLLCASAVALPRATCKPYTLPCGSGAVEAGEDVLL